MRQYFNRDEPAHAHVFAQENAAHAAAAEQFQNAIFRGDEEVALPAAEDLLGLVIGEQAGANHFLRNRLGLSVRIDFQFIQILVEARIAAQTAFADAFHELGAGNGYTHPLCSTLNRNRFLDQANRLSLFMRTIGQVRSNAGKFK